MLRVNDTGPGSETYRLTLTIALITVALVGCTTEEQPAETVAQPVKPEVGFVDSRLCWDCHAEQHQEWKGSHHDLAMQEATAETVLGDFADTSFTHFGVTTRFFKKEDQFYVNTEGPDGQLADFRIDYVFGVYPLQQYLIEFPGGRLQCLTVSWNSRDKNWFHLYPDERIAPDDPLHWTKLYQNWNLMCAECHTTNLRKNYDVESDTYNTTWHEMDVGCQTCHGPGQKHVDWAEQEEQGAVQETRDFGLLVDFKNTDAGFQVDSCAPCHSRRAPIRDDWSHTGQYHDYFRLQTLSENLYYPDGQILDEVYVYGSFLQSKMYEEGVRCTNCHNPHSLKFWVSGNALCTQCHQRQPIPGFPSLKQKEYDSPEHHFHPNDSEGASCVKCHMPERTYMVVDPRSDHSFRIPRPDLSVKLGTPNTCSACHSGQTAEWAADAVENWYGPKKGLEKETALILAEGRQGRPDATEQLADIVQNLDEPAIVRATALELLRNFGSAGFAAARKAIRDKDPMVRAQAAAALEQMADQRRLSAVAPLLQDSSGRVRIEAARVLASVPGSLFTQDQKRAFEAALREFKEAQMVMADMPWSHLNLGVLYSVQGNQQLAEGSYKTAIRLDPSFLPARVNLANLLNQSGRNQEAEKVLRQALVRAADHGELHYNLGLLLAEMGRLEEAVQVLARAADLMPNRARIRYNRALALQHLGRREEAEAAMLKAHEVDPEDTDIVYALAVFYSQGGDWEKALGFAETLNRLLPAEAGPRQLLEQIRRNITR